jgi:hypothetical protein
MQKKNSVKGGGRICATFSLGQLTRMHLFFCRIHFHLLFDVSRWGHDSAPESKHSISMV